MDKLSRKYLMSIPKRDCDQRIKDATGVFVIPSRKKHDSGWACMDFVATTEDGMIRFGGNCDDVSFEGRHFRMDCDFDTKLLHIWNTYSKFTISADMSSIYFIEQEND